jgi:serine/threonine protein kinase
MALTERVESKVLEAFDSIHRLGVVHNDVKPDNILVAQPEGSVWIVDFEDAGTGNDLTCAVERQLVRDVISRLKGGADTHGG